MDKDKDRIKPRYLIYDIMQYEVMVTKYIYLTCKNAFAHQLLCINLYMHLVLGNISKFNCIMILKHHRVWSSAPQ